MKSFERDWFVSNTTPRYYVDQDPETGFWIVVESGKDIIVVSKDFRCATREEAIERFNTWPEQRISLEAASFPRPVPT